MSKSDEVVYNKQEMLLVIKRIEFVLISLHKIGSLHSDVDRQTYESWTTEFIDKNGVTGMLADIREVLSSQFSNELGEDDMSELERAMEDVECWQPPAR